MGDIFGFRVSVGSGKIMERISGNDLLKKWGVYRDADLQAGCEVRRGRLSSASLKPPRL